ncbi:zinc-dependent alcohol dehydrogenase [Aquisalinus flavus]|uniref:Glutathione-dependent formaldehyde dehydrogenase n=1 Tax=Aquisalinus flavus TaxID=1526572 RepID=A0A8J2V1J4_9PROT|nr:zinc-dependent alcohol dehydrogenase [Aquisalinus flavus]MBD0427301.1 glutathione-dependent formaldehyde dehydrogenase [Aquisalinus flavus]UNE47109.1 glutathione-dependent formaldehyde dehydrogenase [Aquisalinus flavus]GGC99901.1 glutathione-dependent formaldehyde dehydrogenase [Aquisalinus flavus]
MKAVVFHGVGDIRLDTVSDPEISDSRDAIVRITNSAICGTDLHFVRGTMGGLKEGQILGHEAIGIIEEVGKGVRNFKPGDRVVIPSTVSCGGCSYCRSGYTGQCDEANPNGKRAGTAFYGGPEAAGGFDGLQAEYARIPYANTSLVRLPSSVTDDQAIMLSDIYPTGYFGADMAEISQGDTVAVFGCGPVGQFAVISAYQLGAARVIAVDGHEDRLERARFHGAETVNFNTEDPVEAIVELTNGIGVDRAIDAVGVDAEVPKSGPAKQDPQDDMVAQIVEESGQDGTLWKPGDGPMMATKWAVAALAKAGTLSIIGVYPPNDNFFPIGQAMNKSLSINMGNCNHRSYIPHLIEMVERGNVDPAKIITQDEEMVDAITAYEQFDQRKSGWVKVELEV